MQQHTVCFMTGEIHFFFFFFFGNGGCIILSYTVHAHVHDFTRWVCMHIIRLYYVLTHANVVKNQRKDKSGEEAIHTRVTYNMHQIQR